MRAAVQLLGLSAITAWSVGSWAVCLNPNDSTATTYYYPTLQQEMKASAAIVVGKVIRVLPLAEDPSDPEGWTAFIYKFRVTEQLRGRVSPEITLRAENDSGGYRMRLGEKHLLFLDESGALYRVDPCGNSAQLPKGNATLERVKSTIKPTTSKAR